MNVASGSGPVPSRRHLHHRAALPLSVANTLDLFRTSGHRLWWRRQCWLCPCSSRYLGSTAHKKQCSRPSTLDPSPDVEHSVGLGFLIYLRHIYRPLAREWRRRQRFFPVFGSSFASTSLKIDSPAFGPHYRRLGCCSCGCVVSAAAPENSPMR